MRNVQKSKKIFIWAMLFCFAILVIAWLYYIDKNQGNRNFFAISGAFIFLVILAFNRLNKIGMHFNNFGFSNDLLLPRHIILMVVFGFIILATSWNLDIVPIVLTSNQGLVSVSNINFYVLLSTMILLAIFQEIAFRGMIYSIILRLVGVETFANILAVIIQAIVFGALHYSMGFDAIIILFFHGIAYGFLTFLSEYRLWPAMILHVMVNVSMVINNV